MKVEIQTVFLFDKITVVVNVDVDFCIWVSMNQIRTFLKTIFGLVGNFNGKTNVILVTCMHDHPTNVDKQLEDGVYSQRMLFLII